MKLREQNWTRLTMVVEEGANHVERDEEEQRKENRVEEERKKRVEEEEKNAKLIL